MVKSVRAFIYGQTSVFPMALHALTSCSLRMSKPLCPLTSPLPQKQTYLLALIFKRCQEACSVINFSLTFLRTAEFISLVQVQNTGFFSYHLCFVFPLTDPLLWCQTQQPQDGNKRWWCHSWCWRNSCALWRWLLFNSIGWQGSRYLGLVTALSEVSPLGLGVSLLNVWQDSTSSTVVRHPRFHHYTVIIDTFQGRQPLST